MKPNPQRGLSTITIFSIPPRASFNFHPPNKLKGLILNIQIVESQLADWVFQLLSFSSDAIYLYESYSYFDHQISDRWD
ncbi:hypothetical protein ACS0TY_005816 [Phlomoides rotata]